MSISQKQPRDFGKRSGLKIPPVSAGTMRLPKDENEAIDLFRQAIDAGMIYLDCSRGYGETEIVIGKALKDGYREKVILSTKWSPWNIKVEDTDDKSADCTYKRILESIQRLDVEYLDFYHIWSVMNPEQYQGATKKGGMLDGIIRAKDEGLVKHIGMTTHDKPENISKQIETADWCEVILFTYNIMNQTYKNVLAQTHEKGIGTMVMNPVFGGLLNENSPTLNSIIKEATGLDDPIEAALRYLAADENIDTILCGLARPSDIMSTIETYQKPPLSPEQVVAVENEVAKLKPENLGFCTQCGYCQPCPEGIDIPNIMRAIYAQRVLKCPKRAQGLYNWAISSDRKVTHPSKCTECGQCEAKCTQKISIIEELKYAVKTFEKDI